MATQPGFFDVEQRLQRLSDIGDQLEAYAAVVDFELFRPDLEAALGYSDGAKGGRPPYDPVLMFKILVIQAQNGLGDDKAEFLINDRLSFMRFLGLGLSDRVPDAKTIWMFRERLTRAGAIDRLFRRFDAAIRAAGYIAMSGQLVDSTLVAAPKQRNTRDEKQAAKAGKTAHEIWPDQPAKARQKDVDARWTIQTGKARPDPERKALLDIAIPTFGYKAHTNIDRRYRLIRCWDVTDASRHDGWLLRQGLLDPTNTGAGVWADTAYRSQQNETFMERHGFISHIHRRRRPGRPLPAHIRRGNATRSRERAPVEHVFAVQKQAMGLIVRTIGLARARTKIGMANLAFNIRRLVQLRGRVTA